MYKKPKITILGASGFIGRNLLHNLLKEKYHVNIFDRQILNDTLYNKYYKQVNKFQGDFLNLNDLKKALIDCDYCFHLISSTIPKVSNLNPIYDIETNLCGTIGLLDTAIECGVKKIIFASSGGTIYGNSNNFILNEDHPTNPLCSYGIVKLSIEKYLYLYSNMYNIETCSLRIANPYGPNQIVTNGQGVISTFFHKILKNEEIHIWGDGSAIRDFIYVDDVSKAFIKVIQDKAKSSIYNIGSNEGKSINEILQMIETITQKKAKVIYDPARNFDVNNNILDNKLAYKKLGWKPEVNLYQGLEKTWKNIINTVK